MFITFNSLKTQARLASYFFSRRLLHRRHRWSSCENIVVVAESYNTTLLPYYQGGEIEAVITQERIIMGHSNLIT